MRPRAESAGARASRLAGTRGAPPFFLPLTCDINQVYLPLDAGIAQLVEYKLPKLGVASSSLVARSRTECPAGRRFFFRAWRAGLVRLQAVVEVWSDEEISSFLPALENLFFTKGKWAVSPLFFLSATMTEESGTYQQGVIRAVVALIEPVLNDLGYELVEVQFRREAHGQVLRVIIFRPEGIGVEDCARVSREVGHLLDVEDLIEQAFHLEVSSPGLDRPLQNARDFARYRGSRVRLILAETGEEIIGLIGECGEEELVLETPDGARIIPLSLVKKAKLVIDF